MDYFICKIVWVWQRGANALARSLYISLGRKIISDSVMKSGFSYSSSTRAFLSYVVFDYLSAQTLVYPNRLPLSHAWSFQQYNTISWCSSEQSRHASLDVSQPCDLYSRIYPMLIFHMASPIVFPRKEHSIASYGL